MATVDVKGLNRTDGHGSSLKDPFPLSADDDSLIMRSAMSHGVHLCLTVDTDH